MTGALALKGSQNQQVDFLDIMSYRSDTYTKMHMVSLGRARLERGVYMHDWVQG